ncbi:MAG: KamA family radical SAM protein [Acidobacteria bacterium]|nr:KamA family radical SAM protein [Acidobacteriota bacterium]
MNDHAPVSAEELEPPSRGAARARFGGTPTSFLAARAVVGTAVQTDDGRSEASRESEQHRATSFRRKHFPTASATEWRDWQWQVRNRLARLEALERVLVLTERERRAIEAHRGQLPFAVTPYYASLLDPLDSEQPLRRTVIPDVMESVVVSGEAIDPLAEEAQSPVPGLVHRYPDRVLFLVTAFCSTYCRYCTRSRVVGDLGELQPSPHQWEAALRYIAGHTEIRDVLLSGGDPLTLSDDKLQWLLGRLRAIPHVEIIRLGTKVPAVLPQRITPQLVWMLRRFHPLMMSLHFTHPDELTPEAAKACARLADAGVPLGSQTVLLRGVNDSVDTMRRLMHGLLRLRVRPYYLYQCDPVVGTSQFRTPVQSGLEIIAGLRGHTSGYAVPTYVIDAPGGGGKIPLAPDALVGREGDDVLLRNYEGKVFRYPDTTEGAKP